MLSRLDAMRAVLEQLPGQPVVANCGATARELASLAHPQPHLYILDSMGLASSVGLGLSLALADTPVERVVVFDGDGSLLMNLGSLASIAFHRPDKLLLVVLDNAVYASTGGQPTYASHLDLGAISASTSLTTLAADNAADLRAVLAGVGQTTGPIMLHVRIAPDNAAGIDLLLEDPAVIADRFARWIDENFLDPR